MSVLPTEGNQPQGTGAGAASTTPSTQPGQPLKEPTISGPQEVLEKALQKIERLEGEVSALKKGKDRAVDRVERSNSELIAKIGQRLGVSADQVREAQRQNVLDELIEERMTGQSSTVAPQGNAALQEAAGVPAGNTLLQTQQIKAQLGLPANDPRVAALDLDYRNDPVEYLRLGIALRDQLQGKAPTPAEQILPTGSAPVKQDATTRAELQREYETKRDALMQKQQPHARRIEELADLKAEYAGKGLPLR